MADGLLEQSGSKLSVLELRLRFQPSSPAEPLELSNIKRKGSAGALKVRATLISSGRKPAGQSRDSNLMTCAFAYARMHARAYLYV